MEAEKKHTAEQNHATNEHERNAMYHEKAWHNIKKFAEMLRIIKNDAKAEHFEQKAEKRKELINKYFLKDGLYYDYNFVDKEHSFLLTAASLYPYTFGISSDKEGAKKVFNLLRQKYGLTSTVDFESENKLQWDFPSVWPPLVYFEYIAFKNLNMQEEADFVAKTYKNNVEYNYEKTGKIWEKYKDKLRNLDFSKLLTSIEHMEISFVEDILDDERFKDCSLGADFIGSITKEKYDTLVGKFDAVILGVAHNEFKDKNIRELLNDSSTGVVYDVKGILDRNMIDGRL